MNGLSPEERRELKDLAEQLITVTSGGTYWLSRLCETSIELRERINHILDSEVLDDAPRGSDE